MRSSPALSVSIVSLVCCLPAEASTPLERSAIAHSSNQQLPIADPTVLTQATALQANPTTEASPPTLPPPTLPPPSTAPISSEPAQNPPVNPAPSPRINPPANPLPNLPTNSPTNLPTNSGLRSEPSSADGSPVLAPNVLENTIQDGRLQISPTLISPIVPPAQSDSKSDSKPDSSIDSQGNPIGPPEHLQQVQQALINSSQRYPFLVNPTGRIPFRFTLFSPTRKRRNSYIELEYRDRQMTVEDLAIAQFPKAEQIYSILPGNRIVIETKGWVGDLDYQGQAKDTTIVQTFKTSQALWGLQSVWLLPQPLQDLVSQDKFKNSTILSIAGEAVNPSNTGNVTINLNLASLNSAPTQQRINTARIGTASTNSTQGGGSLFTQLEASNAPTVLQAFPSNNLQVLLEGEGLFKGAKVSPQLLEKAGITFGNPLTGEGFRFQPQVTSEPGIKVAKPDQFDNFELLNILVNPYLSEKQRQLYYLNSLHWLSLGVRPPEILSTTRTSQQQNWYQFRLNRPHNRTMLQYEAAPGRATYYNLFSNPGAAVTFSLDAKEIHIGQSLNTTAGGLLGAAFGWIHPFRLEKSIWEAQLRFHREENFKPLRTQTTSEQRKQINQRLDRILNLAQLNSGISQLTGILSTPVALTPDRADMFQIRAGNHRRRVQMFDIQQTTETDQIYISKLKLSTREFGPLRTIGVPIPKSLTNITAQTDSKLSNSAVKTIITSEDGSEQLEFSSDENQGEELTSVPVGVRTFDTAFDRIELAQNGRINSLIEGFDGYMHVPAIEALWQRSRGNFSYIVSAGAWKNFAPNQAPNVPQNRLGDREVGLGIYTNATINWQKMKTHFALPNNNPSANPSANPPNLPVRKITNQIATIQANWNSAANRNNPIFLNLSYSYLQQTKNSNYAMTIGAFLAKHPQKSDGQKKDGQKTDFIGFWRHQLALQSGLDLIGSLELSDRPNFLFEAMQRLSPRWSAGLYYQNFQSQPGLGQRSTGKEYGLIVQHRSRRGPTWQARLSRDSSNWELKLQGNFNF